jgi:hypothetical protein
MEREPLWHVHKVKKGLLDLEASEKIVNLTNNDY